MTGRGFHLLMTTDAVGGIWTYALDLGRALRERGARVTLANLGPAPAEANRQAARDAGLALVVLDHRPEWLAADAGEVARGGEALAGLARQIGADLIQLNHPALAAEADFPVPVLAVGHSCVATWWASVKGTPLPPDFAWQAALIGAGYRAAAALAVPSRAFAEATRAAYRLASLPVVVHNGRRAPVVADTGARPPVTAALTLGRLWDEGKDVAAMDRAASLTAVPIQAIGPTRGPNGTVVAPRCLQPTGSLSETEVRARLAEQPVYISAARYEPFGLAVLEAAQAGCALVLSEIGSFRELWDDAALFVAPGDAAGFAAAVDRLIAEPDLRARLSRAARDRAARYTIEAQATRMADLMAPFGFPAASAAKASAA